jgi:hypothetical protein
LTQSISPSGFIWVLKKGEGRGDAMKIHRVSLLIVVIASVAAMMISVQSANLAPASEIIFPPTHPPTAICGTGWLTSYYDSFNIYVWRENGHVWLEIEPLWGEPFLCGDQFSVVQNGVQLTDDPYLEISNGDGFCDYVYAPSIIFRLVKYETVALEAKFVDYVEDPQEFILSSTRAGGTYFLDIPAVPVAPTAAFTADPINGSIPLTVNFTDQSTGDIASWQWDFGDGLSSTEQNPSHEYDTLGKLTVSLTVTGPGGVDTETKTNLISVASDEIEKQATPWISLLLLDD